MEFDECSCERYDVLVPVYIESIYVGAFVTFNVKMSKTLIVAFEVTKVLMRIWKC